MKYFYIETDKLMAVDKIFRYVYSEDGNTISITKIVDPITKEEISMDHLIRIDNNTFLLNIQTAYLANYKRTYFDINEV